MNTVNTFTKLINTVLLSAAALMAACGGSETSDPPMMTTDPYAALAAAQNQTEHGGCIISLADYRKLQGLAAPRPDPLPEGSEWRAPFLLVPATNTGPIEFIPGVISYPVVVLGSQGQPMNVTGPYIEPDIDVPSYVCAPRSR